MSGSQPNASAHAGFGEILQHAGFRAFLWTQFLGAFNDNLYKIIVSMRAVHVAAATGSGSEYLSLAGAVFVIPYFLFSGYSGHLADTVSKRSVLIGVKIFEVVVMLLGLAVFFATDIRLMLIVLFLMAVHATVFSPAKYGIVPEILPKSDLSRANALLEMSTFVAIVLGTSLGTFLFSVWKNESWKMGVAMTLVAVAGYLVSRRITPTPPSNPTQKFHWNPLSEVIIGTKHLLADRPMWLAVIAISYFWFIGALFQMDILLFGSEVLKVGDLQIGLMVTALAVTIGAGNMLAGRLSGHKVELGLIPIGSFLMSVFCVGLWLVKSSYGWSIVMLCLLGAASGLFIVPLYAYLQQRSDDHEKGRIIAANNIWNTVGLLLASGVLSLFHDVLHLTPDQLILFFGIVTLAATVYIVRIIPEFLIRFSLWMLTHTMFRIRIVGREHLPLRGPALIVSNHTIHFDGFIIQACMQRFIRFLLWRPYYEQPSANWFWKLAHAIPVTESRRDIVNSLRIAHKELAAGHVVAIFAEGGLTRTGNLLPFRRGLEKIVHGLDVPVIPVHIDGLWDSIYSYSGGKFFGKRPRRLRQPVTITFGAPIPSATATAPAVRQIVSRMASDSMSLRKAKDDLLSLRLIRQARAHWNRFAMADSSGRELTYGKTLTAAVLIADWLDAHAPGQRNIGLLLPATVAGALANLGVTLSARIPVNLNFTAGRAAMDSAIAQCELRTIITSRTFLEKAHLDAPAGAVFIEDILTSVSGFAKLTALIAARFKPARLLARAAHQTPDSLATIVFSSGSTGEPKGVMLSHYNVIADSEGMRQVFPITSTDRIVGSLPLFHSFGFTVTVWFPLIAGCGAIYHPDPTAAKAVGDLIEKYKGTFLISAPAFYANYARKCTKQQFASLRFAISGAEKLRENVAQAFREAFDLELLEGYGCTEMAPVVSVNVPDWTDGTYSQTGHKPGSVGHPLPGVAAKTVDPATMEDLEPGAEGLILLHGANRMIGYLGHADQPFHDGWYVTGDIGVVDEDGFIFITDRLSRFSKIGGEMVPHGKVEEAIHAAIGGRPCSVTSIPCEQKGERVVALYTNPEIDPATVWRELTASDLPRIWIPKPGDIHQVDSLPALGSGKLDMRAVRTLAKQFSNGAKVPRS